MAQDLRTLFKQDQKVSHTSMADGHEQRFLKKLEEQLPEAPSKPNYHWLRIAASIVLFVGLGFTVFKFLEAPNHNPADDHQVAVETSTNDLKSLGDISPDLKKIENYYVANINLELSKVQITDDNKELFDSYIVRLGELNTEYKRLSQELTDNGPNELTVSALIDNLKLRLNLLYRLKKQLKELNESEEHQTV